MISGRWLLLASGGIDKSIGAFVCRSSEVLFEISYRKPHHAERDGYIGSLREL
jgi:hypothetical protein